MYRKLYNQNMISELKKKITVFKFIEIPFHNNIINIFNAVKYLYFLLK